MSNVAVRAIELNHMNDGARRVLKDTLTIYRRALQYVIPIVSKHYSELAALSNEKERLTYTEHLIHTTKNHQASYLFDQEFPKFPSCYRRSMIHDALGAVFSYKTRLIEYQQKRKKYIDAGKRFQEKPPVLNPETVSCPSMYKNQMYTMNGLRILIKVYIRHTWDWMEVSTPARDKKDLERHAAPGKLKSPMLSYKFHKFYLTFPIEYEKSEFEKLDLNEQTILAIDLGVNRGATGCIMTSSGTILKRFFDPFTSERDQMNHLINKIRKASRMSGKGQELSSLYTKLDGVKLNYTRQLAHWITSIAEGHDVYGVVFEYLGNFGKTRSARIHHWCKRRIQDMVKGMCLRSGIRTFFINPRNTSKLAFDGSGSVTRGVYLHHGKERYHYSVCTFPSGKQYNCDLNACYNIGARYFLRAILKSLTAMEASELMAKVPELQKRTNCTLSTLKKLAA